MPRSAKKGLLERLSEGVVVGDGGFVFALEKRGYVRFGSYTPEAVVEHPEAVRQLHREFLRAGSDVMQTFTFFASDGQLIYRGTAKNFTGEDINNAACKLAREVANEGNALVAGSISETYLSNSSKEAVQAQFRKQVQVFVAHKVDFLICEYFKHVEEIEWAIQVCRETDLPVASTMCIGVKGDHDGVPLGECAVRMAKAGAHVVGLNCHYGPFSVLNAIKIVRDALKEAGHDDVYLMCQALGYHTPDADKEGFIDLPEYPFALEPRVCTRWDMQRYARQAYELGVRYIGTCCGSEPYHTRAISEELANERGFLPRASEKHDPWGEGLKQHTKPWVRARASRSYWENLQPATGRPYCPSLSCPGGAQEDKGLKQHSETTSK